MEEGLPAGIRLQGKNFAVERRLLEVNPIKEANFTAVRSLPAKKHIKDGTFAVERDLTIEKHLKRRISTVEDGPNEILYTEERLKVLPDSDYI